MMTTDKLHTFVKRWNQLAKAQADLDYQKSVYAKDLRAEFGTDASCVKWCEAHLNLTEYQAKELLDRAAAVKVISDPKVWAQVGGSRGFENIRPMLKYPKKEQVAIVEAAKVEALQIPSIIRKRHPEPVQVTKPTSRGSSPIIARPVTTRKMSDADLLAKWIAENAASLPMTPELENVVRMYVPTFTAKRANVTVRRRPQPSA